MAPQSIRARLYHFHNLHTYDKEEWYTNIRNYLMTRYPAIVNRLTNSFRYVELHPDNKFTFSYEYASLLRDIGGTISSVLDSFVNKTGRRPSYGKNFNIRDYRDFLLDEILDLNEVYVRLNVGFKESHLFPFKNVKKGNKKTNLFWWKAYNDTKHTEIYKLKQGCLSNVLYAFSALTIIYYQITFPPKVFMSKEFMSETGNLVAHIGALTPNLIVENFPSS